MAETDAINVPCLDFGEGRIIVTTVHTDEWAGIELSDAKGPHSVGDFVPGEDAKTNGPLKPSRENVYMRFLNVESVDVVIAALKRARKFIKAKSGSQSGVVTEYKADYRDCIELAGQLAECIESADGQHVYEGDDLPGQFIPVLQPVIGELQELREIVERLPATADNRVVLPGVVILCPKGHAHQIQKHEPFSGRIYCTKGDCWSDGCQGDSGSGTHYDAKQCTRAADALG